VAPGGFIDIINVSGKHITSIFNADVEPSVEKSGNGYKEKENWGRRPERTNRYRFLHVLLTLIP
jgi:hypothetical protein